MKLYDFQSKHVHLWFVILLTTEEVRTHSAMAAVQARPCRLGALGIWKEFPSEMRQLVGRWEHSLLQRRLHHSCCQHQTRRCLHVRCRRGRSALRDTSRLSAQVISSSGNNTMRAVRSSRGHNTNRARTFLHFLRIVWARGKSEAAEIAAVYLGRGTLKIEAWPAAIFLLAHRNTEIQHSASATEEALQLQRPTEESVIMFTSVIPIKNTTWATFPPTDPDGSHVVATGIPGCSRSAGVQQLGEVMGIPESWAQSQTLNRLKPQQSRPQGLNQSGLHGGKIAPISLQRTRKHLENSSVWLSRENSGTLWTFYRFCCTRTDSVQWQ